MKFEEYTPPLDFRRNSALGMDLKQRVYVIHSSWGGPSLKPLFWDEQRSSPQGEMLNETPECEEPKPFQIDDFYCADGTPYYKKAFTNIQSLVQKNISSTTQKNILILSNIFILLKKNIYKMWYLLHIFKNFVTINISINFLKFLFFFIL